MTNNPVSIEKNHEICYLAGGCFWCLDAVYRRMNGVVEVECGYSNGQSNQPTYQEVCNGTTKCAEVVKITFDSNFITFQDILTVFWRIHDPTTRNRQGNDLGTQYRSGIYYGTPAQKEIAELSKSEAESLKLWDKPFVTEILPIANYFPAEYYHQNYFEQNPNQPYCIYVVDKKVKIYEKYLKEGQ